jgi:DNA-binding HxlR family transcriptional regulator
VRDAILGKRRFGEFQESLGLAKNILSARLKKLVAEGIFLVAPDTEGSRYKIYELTRKGADLGIVLVSLWQWGSDHCFSKGELRRVLIDSERHEPLAKLSLTTRSGRTVAPRDHTTIPKGERTP